ncbi:hypothetical protein FJ938_22050 [Mesorhizobium sp. B2-4-14]|uniref:hypothetical protein n=1 Tax=Mesorhizobium sp. B2-4-14 TaxID=2589935 RepID=UPI00112DDE4E|nr:hypothetical protein [Mesorhizobium sp. B2-4-14]TPL00678.1 hypothetical protein FJ938_22050 [Mesorhizobium sp. B2-4-14]
MTEPELSASLRRLLDIMTSPEVPVPQSVAAARAIVEYEAPPEVFELCCRFLIGVAEDPKSDVGLQLKSLELLRKVEAKRVSPGTIRGADPMEGVGRRLEEARLRAEAKRKVMN